MRFRPRITIIASIAGIGTALAMLGPSVAAPGGTRTWAHPGAVDGRLLFVDFSMDVIDTANPDGTAIVQVTPQDPDIFRQAPTWEPDGRHILYAASVNGGDFRIHEIATDGTGDHVAIHARRGYSDYIARVTPDGSRVVFNLCRPDPPGGCALVSQRMDGTDRQKVLPFHSPRRGGLGDPGNFALSPDSRHVAYTLIGRRGIAEQIWVSRLDGSHARPVSRTADELTSLSWLDDRTLIVNGPNFHLGDGISLLSLRTGTLTSLFRPRFPHGAYVGQASPSGRQIVFLSDRDFPDLSGNHAYIMNADGTQRHRVNLGLDNIGVVFWGTAPLLPASAATPRSQLATPLPMGERHRIESRIPWVGAPRDEPPPCGSRTDKEGAPQWLTCGQ
jgi:Tol biopolymer transport system component